MTDPKFPLEPLTRDWLAAIGEDPEREGLTRTPHRVAASACPPTQAPPPQYQHRNAT